MVRVKQQTRPETLRCPRCGRPLNIGRFGDVKFAYCYKCDQRYGWVHDWTMLEYEWR